MTRTPPAVAAFAVALTVALSLVLTGGAAAVEAAIPASASLAPAAGLLETVQGFIDALDRLLESVLDLLRTLSQLFGEGEGGD